MPEDNPYQLHSKEHEYLKNSLEEVVAHNADVLADVPVRLAELEDRIEEVALEARLPDAQHDHRHVDVSEFITALEERIEDLETLIKRLELKVSSLGFSNRQLEKEIEERNG